MIQFDNTYIRLPNDFYKKTIPSAATQPKLISFNKDLAGFLGFDYKDISDQSLALIFSGKNLPESSKPIALAYAGHQFGHFNPQLGDGRAVLIGEVTCPSNQQRYDVQLKGSGPTFFSRGGDGFSSLGPVLREYIVSEAMYSLGVPTTRTLAAVETGAQVMRETNLPGAILTRVATSHIRVGTFEFFANREQVEHIKTLADYTISRHYPSLGTEDDKYNLMLLHIGKRKLSLVAQWMSFGFIHGVMNTDNTSVSGETIDYGPCAFMDEFEINKVFSSIDRQGRYAYSNQAPIALWNIGALTNALLPLLKRSKESKESCIERLQNQSEELKVYYKAEYLKIMSKKLGIFNSKNVDQELIQSFLSIMEKEKLDFTNTFRSLSLKKFSNKNWNEKWTKRLGEQSQTWEQSVELMSQQNPFIIPRNHQVEKAIQLGLKGDYSHFHLLNKAFKKPYIESKEFQFLTAPPLPNEIVQQTFCGT